MGKLNKYEEALDFLFDNIRVTQTTQLNMEGVEFAGEVLQELIDKETPMKPKYCKEYPSASCAKCGSNLGDNTRCRECGQKIDWSDEE